MKTIRVVGACLVGIDAELVTVEARFEPADQGRTEVALSGLPDPVIRESRGRLLLALEAIGLAPGSGRLFLNLVPAGVRKTGEALDLALALGAAAAAGHIDPRALVGSLFLGEVGIDGVLHAVPGGLAGAEAARRAGLARFVGPLATAREASAVLGVDAFGARTLGDVVALVAGGPAPAERIEPEHALGATAEPDARALAALAGVRGQATGKRALAVAAAGDHGLLFIGPPGTGKSLLARALPCLLSAPCHAERIEITRVLSACGRWPGGLATQRPFRAPHHTTSYAGLVGGGKPPGPGEITLAHGGVLFLDELPEFRREALEALRQPLESGRVAISRAGRQVELPARFQLVCAMNPCPCGYRGHPRTPCRCGPTAVEHYRRRLSGPLLDRIDLRVELAAPSLDELAPRRARREARAREEPEAAGELRARVQRARALALERQAGLANAALDADRLDAFAAPDAAGRALLEAAVHHRGLSARAVQSLRRVARTLADLDAALHVGAGHLAEALALRAEV